MSDKPLTPSTCSNFSFFKDMLKELRRVDDNIILRLNSTDTHSEQACGDFFKQLASAYRKREDAVDYCLKVMDAEIDRKTNLLQQDPDDYDTQSSLFSDETKRRMIANELVVEGIVRDRTIQVFKSKCRVFDVSSLQTKQ
ncbi:caffeine-induced death protein 2 [Halteromyces radiatus]|uniref:caffeine-induced death protein 2 n=1 Tax=Halteromyces radiatus TaxID=101107 RepID=UPI00221F75D1|nr:caffeine-induced death protein 2 [Halteromyces radiatus]KAI8098922.1 caffeine-induced death protein 2 [Halteromyces radiatus]